MNKRLFALLSAVITFTVGVAIASLSLPNLLRKTTPPLPKELPINNYRLSGPYTFNNLSIFLVHGPDESGNRVYTPLQDAMKREVVIVHETSDVNELMIENVSPSEDVFVQAGDIVKGGKQDRVLAVDLILPASSGKIPISAFCVEHSRWQPRRYESGDQFTLTEMSAGFSLRRAIKGAVSQVGVWDEVEKSQQKMSTNLSSDVRSDQSPTSLPLALESDAVQESAAPYVNELSRYGTSANDVLGVIFTINNELIGGDVYSSNLMFKRTWPRLLNSAAIEALAELGITTDAAAVPIETAASFVVNSARGAETLDTVTPRTQVVKREIENGLFFETRDMDYDGAWIHRSYLSKKQ
jgi:hypothetical protein